VGFIDLPLNLGQDRGLRTNKPPIPHLQNRPCLTLNPPVSVAFQLFFFTANAALMCAHVRNPLVRRNGVLLAKSGFTEGKGEPTVGIEPTTSGLQTTELSLKINHIDNVVAFQLSFLDI
jgi:hypothetical protein